MLNEEKLNEIIQSLKQKNNGIIEEPSSSSKKIDFCLYILNKLNSDYQEWIENCPLSKEYYTQYISVKFIEKDDVRDEFYFACASLLREYSLYLERSNQNYLNNCWSCFLENSPKLIDSENNYSQKKLQYFINKNFDIDVINKFLGSKDSQFFKKTEENFKNIVQIQKEIEDKKNEIEDKKNKIESFIKNKYEEVKDLEKTLENQKTAFNFVGLSKGFENLLSKKESAKNKSFILMIVICIALTLFPLLFICARFLNWINIQWTEISWEHMLPVLGLEFVLIYFFRVVLNHYNSIQTQIMQIELRQALCQFIQSYIDYAKEIKDKEKEHGGNSLEKFENLIFSNILSSPDKVPSTFDGVEQLANMINSIKGKN